VNIVGNLRRLLANPEMKGVDVDGPGLLEVHKRTLARKRLMREVFDEFYLTFMEMSVKYLAREGKHIELGSGSSDFKKKMPELITSDIVASPHLDMVLDAQAMDVADNSVAAFYASNCLHHLPKPRLFFQELERTLVPGGGCVLIEPHYGAFSTFLHKRMHAHEYFDANSPGWDTVEEGRDIMSGSNQALSYIIFVRDRQEFEQEFPGLELVLIKPLSNGTRYLLSGGLNFRQLVPDFLSTPLKGVEAMLAPVRHHTALHHVVVLRKRKSS
jgi:SAM-dependent methyltransferase